MVRPILVGRERPAERGADPEHVEIIRAHSHGGHALSFAVGDERGGPRTHDGNRLERSASRAVVHGGREPDVRRGPVGVAIAERDQPVWRRIRQRAKQRRVDNREDGGVGADAERQGEQRRGRESRSAREHPHRIAEVLHQHVNRGNAALIAPGLGNLGGAAQRQAGRPRRLEIRQPARAMLLLQHVAMELQFFFQSVAARVATSAHKAQCPPGPLAPAAHEVTC
jgi:hypothetical protein